MQGIGSKRTNLVAMCILCGGQLNFVFNSVQANFFFGKMKTFCQCSGGGGGGGGGGAQVEQYINRCIIIT